MTVTLPSERRVDALCDAYVDDYCALDPLTATSIGVAGHEHEMTDYHQMEYRQIENVTKSFHRSPPNT